MPESCQTFEVAIAEIFGLVYLVLSCQSVFLFNCKHLFIDKPIVIVEPAVASTQLLGVGWKLYPTKILLDSCRVFLEYTKIEKAKERLFWSGASPSSLLRFSKT